MAPVVRLLWFTGARPSELLRLTVRDIDRTDPDQWVAVLKDHKTSHRDGAKPRVLVFDPPSQDLLRPFLVRRPADLLFRGKRSGDVVDSRQLNRAVARARRKTKPPVPHWTPYMIRHSAATDADEKAGREVARDLLGHESHIVTGRYIHEDAVAKAKAASRKRCAGS